MCRSVMAQSCRVVVVVVLVRCFLVTTRPMTSGSAKYIVNIMKLCKCLETAQRESLPKIAEIRCITSG